MDTESPHIDRANWEHRGHYYAKASDKLDILHKFTTDKARDIFEVHDLLPTSARIMVCFLLKEKNIMIVDQ